MAVKGVALDDCFHRAASIAGEVLGRLNIGWAKIEARHFDEPSSLISADLCSKCCSALMRWWHKPDPEPVPS
jgi:hypothetical protein